MIFNLEKTKFMNNRRVLKLKCISNHQKFGVSLKQSFTENRIIINYYTNLINVTTDCDKISY